MKSNRKNQVYTEIRQPATTLQPVLGRKYTMTHSDETADLFVTIGTNYATDQVSSFRDEVLLTWFPMGNSYLLYGQVLVDGEGVAGSSETRYNIFKREMPIALGAIRYADHLFFDADPVRDTIPIMIHFKSDDPAYNQLMNFGSMSQYTNFDR